MVKREETAGTTDLDRHQERPRRGTRGRIDFTLRILVHPQTQPATTLPTLNTELPTLVSVPNAGILHCNAIAGKR